MPACSPPRVCDKHGAPVRPVSLTEMLVVVMRVLAMTLQGDYARCETPGRALSIDKTRILLACKSRAYVSRQGLGKNSLLRFGSHGTDEHLILRALNTAECSERNATPTRLSPDQLIRLTELATGVDKMQRHRV